MAEADKDTDALRVFFERAGLDDLASRFIDEDIDLEMLPQLEEGDLKELGLSLGQRKKFRAAVANLASEPAQKGSGTPAERRQLTVLFCDLVGSTNMATHLDPEDMRSVIATYLRTAIGVMESHGGHLAYTQGDGLMVYFGYPIAQEDDAANAIRAAIECLSAVQNLKTVAPGGLNVRLGIATGLVVVGDMASETTTPQDFVVGETPNLAARLQTLAAPGEIIISGETKALAGGAFEYEARGYVELKGFDEPRPVFRPLAENIDTMRFDAHGTDGILPIVGRAAELNTLLALWDDVKAGKGRVVTVGAPPGMGKSRLIRSLSQRLERPAVEMQCAPHLANRSLHPLIRELFADAGMDRAAPPEEKTSSLRSLIEGLETLTEEDMPFLSDLVGLPVPELQALDVNSRARQTRATLMRRLIGMAQENGPYVLVLEDAHWADSSTQMFLNEFATRIADVPILLVISHRPEYVVPDELIGLGAQIELSPLDDAPVRAMIEKVVGSRSFPGVMVRKIIEKTDGVPLFVEELTKTILDSIPKTGAITADQLEALHIPTTLQDSLMSRLDRMGPAKEIAQLGAAIGRSFTAGMLAAIAPKGADIASALELLTEAELLFPDPDMGEGGYIFNHALVQDAAYNSMLRSRRQEIHLALAEAMLREDDAFGAQLPEIVARHCDLGGLAQEAMQHWVAAGLHAAGRAANMPAITYLESAMRLLETLPEAAERDQTELGIQMTLAPAYMAIYGWSSTKVETSAKRAQALAHALGDGESLFGATWGLWTNYLTRGDLVAALETAQVLKTMADLAPPGMPTVAAQYALAFSYFFRGDLEEADEAANKGLKLQTFEIDKAMVPVFQIGAGAALYAIGANISWALGRKEEAYERRLKGIERSMKLKHAPTLVHGVCTCVMIALNGRDWPLLRESMDLADRISDDEGFLYFKPLIMIYQAIEAAWNGGDLAALEQANALIGMVKSANAMLTLDLVEIASAEILIENGQAERALTSLEEFGPDAHKRYERVCWPEYLRVKGLALAALGREDEARSNFEEAIKLASSNGSIPYRRRAQICLERHALPV